MSLTEASAWSALPDPIARDPGDRPDRLGSGTNLACRSVALCLGGAPPGGILQFARATVAALDTLDVAGAAKTRWAGIDRRHHRTRDVRVSQPLCWSVRML